MTLYEIFIMPVEMFGIAFAAVTWGLLIVGIYEFIFKWLNLDSLIEKVKTKWRDLWNL